MPNRSLARRHEALGDDIIFGKKHNAGLAKTAPNHREEGVRAAALFKLVDRNNGVFAGAQYAVFICLLIIINSRGNEAVEHCANGIFMRFAIAVDHDIKIEHFLGVIQIAQRGAVIHKGLYAPRMTCGYVFTDRAYPRIWRYVFFCKNISDRFYVAMLLAHLANRIGCVGRILKPLVRSRTSPSKTQGPL